MLSLGKVPEASYAVTTNMQSHLNPGSSVQGFLAPKKQPSEVPLYIRNSPPSLRGAVFNTQTHVEAPPRALGAKAARNGPKGANGSKNQPHDACPVRCRVPGYYEPCSERVRVCLLKKYW